MNSVTSTQVHVKCSTYTFHFFSFTQLLIFQGTPVPPWLLIASNLVNNFSALDFFSDGIDLNLSLTVDEEQMKRALYTLCIRLPILLVSELLNAPHL